MLPIIGYKISFADVFSGLGNICDADPKERFIQEMRSLIAAKHIFYLSSGTAASYLIFEALKRKSSRKDVILPAYTTRHLIFAIRKAGLNPVLCDVEKDGFNMDTEKLFDSLSANTSCVLCVHMFGLPARGIKDLRQRLPKDIFLIEDAAQAMGSRVAGKYVGTFGDIGFFSLNRGKNLPTYGGGCIVTENDELAQELDGQTQALKKPSFLKEINIFLKMFCFKVALNRLVYSMVYPWIKSREDGKSISLDFEVEALTPLQERWGILFLKKFYLSAQARLKNGMALMEGLKGCPGVILPKIEDGQEPALNRFPIIVEDPVKKRSIQKDLIKAGIEAKELYPKPLHHIFELGYKADDFPYAVSLAEKHLTLPVHPLVDQADVEKMVNVIKSICCR